MFAGEPVDREHADSGLAQVRHVVVADLVDGEVLQLRAASPQLARLLDSANERLRGLLTNPFNLDLAGQMLRDGVTLDFSALRSRADLLHTYWQHRVGDGLDTVVALRAIVDSMVRQGRQVANPAQLAPGPSSQALRDLRRASVLRELPTSPGHASALSRSGLGPGGPDVAEPEPHSRCSVADRDTIGRTPTLALTNSPTVTRRWTGRSANSIGATAMAARPPLLDHDSQGDDRLLSIFRRHRRRPRTSHHHNGRAALRSRHGQNNDGTATQEMGLIPPEPAHADAPRRHGARPPDAGHYAACGRASSIHDDLLICP